MSESQPPPLQPIDFLPPSFREESTERKVRAWRLAVVGTFVLLVAAAAVLQRHTRRGLEQSLARVEVEHAAAESLTARLSEVQSELARLRDEAELVTYLRHPWPRTRILSAVLGPLPAELRLSQLRIGREQQQRGRRGGETGRRPGGTPAVGGARSDLARLRSEFDHRPTLVTLVGTTRDQAALHEYLSRVAEERLIGKAELQSIEQGGDGSAEFHLRLTVQPGYGQPAGPTAPATGDPVVDTATSTPAASAAATPSGRSST